jgi:hypothetical protein
MRKWVSVAAALAMLVWAGPALGDTPAAVYSDFAEDGVLNCGHSRSALKGALSDASLHQYGDPLTFLGLRLAVRKQLAGGCRRSDQRAVVFRLAQGRNQSPPGGQSPPEATTNSPPPTKANTPRKPDRSSNGPRARPSLASPPTTTAGQDGRMELVGVVLLLLALGSGGWAARRAFTD